MTATARKGASKKPSNGEVRKARQTFETNDKAAAIAGANVPGITAVRETPVPIADLYESPDNPRQVFEQEALEKLAASSGSVGVLSPLIVRQRPQGRAIFEILAGARRFRASKLAKLAAVPCKIVSVTDQQAADIMATENLDREDLNPIERARSYELLLLKGGYTQTGLAHRFKVTQGQISNSVRLLELPDEWQARVASRQVTIEQGRRLVRFAKHPKILSAIAKSLGKEHHHDGQFDWFLTQALDAHARPMDTDNWIKNARKFEVTPDAGRELDTVKLEGGRKQWALNVELWDELQQREIEAEERRAEKKAAREAKQAQRGPSAAELEERKAKAENVYAKRLHLFKTRWLQARIADRLKSEEVPFSTCLKLLMFYACDGASLHRERGKELLAGIEAAGGMAIRPRESWHDVDVLRNFNCLDPLKLQDAIRNSIAIWVTHDVEKRSELGAERIEALAAELGVDVAKEWRLTDDFLGLHTREQLLELETEWGLSVSGASMKRKELIDVLIAHGARVAAPRALLKSKAPKR